MPEDDSVTYDDELNYLYDRQRGVEACLIFFALLIILDWILGRKHDNAAE